MNLENQPLAALIKMENVAGDIEIARRIVANNNEAVNYFFDDMRPSLDYISRSIMKENCSKVKGVFCYWPAVWGEFYTYIGAKFINGVPKWHAIDLYRGDNNSRLHNYTVGITTKYFIRIKEKDTKYDKKKESIEEKEFQVMKEFDGFTNIFKDEFLDSFIQKSADISLDGYSDIFKESFSDDLKWAWNKLPIREQKIMIYKAIDDLNYLDVFDDMAQYIKFKVNPDDLPEDKRDKRKEDILSELYKRSRKHLRKLVVTYRNYAQENDGRY